MSKNIDYMFLEIYFFADFRVSSRERQCPSCLRRFGNLGKKHTPGFWSMHFVDFVILKKILKRF